MRLDQIRGLLLEEAVLFLLRRSGYQTILSKGSDDTLKENKAGTLYVIGRGSPHQIDAIADYLVQPPFSNPARLLVEAKFYDKSQVGLTVIRNAVGVVHDVSQFFVPPRAAATSKRRYTYQYAIVSATGFSTQSQSYAYAHDIFLIPLGESRFLKPVLDTIRDVARAIIASIGAITTPTISTALRQAVRNLLQQQTARAIPRSLESSRESLEALQAACFKVGFALVAVASGSFPVFLSPVRGLRLSDLEPVIEVRIFREGQGWFLAPDGRDRPLFSFDLPEHVAAMYAEGGQMSPDRALDLKQDQLRELQAFYVDEEARRILRFRLDRDWIQALRGNL